MPQEHAVKSDYTAYLLCVPEMMSMLKVRLHPWFMEAHPAANKSRGLALVL
jgi:hypothetical protein